MLKDDIKKVLRRLLPDQEGEEVVNMVADDLIQVFIEHYGRFFSGVLAQLLKGGKDELET